MDSVCQHWFESFRAFTQLGNKLKDWSCLENFHFSVKIWLKVEELPVLPFRKQCSLYTVTYCLGFHFQFRGKLNSLAIALSVYPGNFISSSFLFAICPLGKILQVHEVVSAFQRSWGLGLFLPAGQYLNNSWPEVFYILRSTGKEGGGKSLWENRGFILGCPFVNWFILSTYFCSCTEHIGIFWNLLSVHEHIKPFYSFSLSFHVHCKGLFRQITQGHISL